MTSIEEARELLEHSFIAHSEGAECPPVGRLDYLGDEIFNFTTYDSDMSASFAAKALEVCKAINDRTTFEYIDNKENYKWFLLMVNMPFFADKINWGSSIRGVWWDFKIELNSCGLYREGEQITEPLQFSGDQWKLFVAAMIDFAEVK